MKRRIILTMLALCLLLSTCAVGGAAETEHEAMAASALEAVQALASKEIKSITYTRCTEGGALSGTVTHPETVAEIFRRLSGLVLGEESNIGTTDDGLYLIVKAGGEPRTLSFEGTDLVIDGSRYTVDGLSPLKRYIDGLIAAETEKTAAQEDPYQYWDYYNGYAYERNGQLKYWLEFRDEFYLHCLFRSGEPEYHEEVYTLYPDWEASPAQQLTIRTVEDGRENDITHWFESLDFLFSSEDSVLMQVRRNEQTLAGGAEDNLLTGEYILMPREEKTLKQLCVLAQEYYNRNYDFYPPEAAITDNGDGTYTIQLYEHVVLDEGLSHTATSAWYTVDAYGVGIDEISGSMVVLAP